MKENEPIKRNEIVSDYAYNKRFKDALNNDEDIKNILNHAKQSLGYSSKGIINNYLGEFEINSRDFIYYNNKYLLRLKSGAGVLPSDQKYDSSSNFDEEYDITYDGGSF